MPNGLGDNVSSSPSATETFTGDGSASAGDALAINQSSGKLDQADSNDTDVDEFAGIATEDFGSDGDEETFAKGGDWIAHVDSGVSAGERLGVPDSSLAGEQAGQLATEAGGPVLALSDEGGTGPTGDSLDANEAWVRF